VKSVATSRTLRPCDVALPGTVARELMWRHPGFRAPRTVIGLQGAPEARALVGTRLPVDPPQRTHINDAARVMVSPK
jgi:hypothetical protein